MSWYGVGVMGRLAWLSMETCRFLRDISMHTEYHWIEGNGNIPRSFWLSLKNDLYHSLANINS